MPLGEGGCLKGECLPIKAEAIDEKTRICETALPVSTVPADASVAVRLWHWFWQEKPLAYTVLTTLATSPTLIFANLHMVAFLRVHRITAAQVATAHIVYVVWNTVNDMFAGYLCDGFVARRYGSRLTFLCAAQIGWVLTVILPFLPVPQHLIPGAGGTLYYFCCISACDGFFSLVCVARGALTKEITTTEADTVHLKRLNSVFGNAEVVVSLTAYAVWSETVTGPFLTYLCATIVAAVGLNLWSTSRLHRHMREGPVTTTEELPPIMAFLRSLPKDLWVYIGVSALQEIQSVVQGQFGILLMESLLVNSSKAQRVAFIGSLGAVSGVATFLMTWPAERCGVYHILLWTYRIKVALASALAIVALHVGFGDMLFCSFMVMNAVTSAMTAYFHIVVMVNLIEFVASIRREAGASHPMAAYPQACGPALVMAVVACATKPFNSLGTVTGAVMLAGGEDGGHEMPSQNAAFALLAVVPIVVGSLQWVLWGSFFSLRGRSSP